MPKGADIRAETHFNRADTAMAAAERLLLAPDARNLNAACALLQDALESASALKAEDRDPVSLGHLQILRDRARRLDQLLQAAGAFMTGASLVLSRLSAGYVPGGEMRRPDRIGLVSVEF